MGVSYENNNIDNNDSCNDGPAGKENETSRKLAQLSFAVFVGTHTHSHGCSWAVMSTKLYPRAPMRT